MSTPCKLRTSLSPPCALSHWQAQPGSRLVEESYFCPLCQDRAAGIDLLAVALQVVEFSDEEFFDEQLCQHFAENAENVALQGRALWPGGNFEVGSFATRNWYVQAMYIAIVLYHMYNGLLSRP